MPTAVINGARLHYVQMAGVGEGPFEDLVLVHGLATNVAFWYLRYPAAFTQRFRLTMFDLRGHGRSEMTPSGYSPANLGADLTGLLDHLGIARAHLMAHSFGGVVAMNFALKQPDRVQSLVLADTHISAARHVQNPQEWADAQAIQQLLERHGFYLDSKDPYFGYKLLTRIAHLQTLGVDVPYELVDLVNPLAKNLGKRTAQQWLRLMETTSAETEMMGDDGLSLEALRGFTFRIIAMYGERSPAKLTGLELLRVWPHAEFRNIRGAGHFFPATRPDEVISQCSAFWSDRLPDTLRRIRVGEAQRAYFRSDRIYYERDGWYFTTRENSRIGPFAACEDARTALDGLLGVS